MFGKWKVVLDAKLISGKIEVAGKASGRSLLPYRTGTVISESVPSCYINSLPMFEESVKSGRVAFVGSQEPCSSHKADEALSTVPTACGQSVTDSLKTFKKVNVDLKKKSNNSFSWSKRCRPSPLPGSGGDGVGIVFTSVVISSFCKDLCYWA